MQDVFGHLAPPGKKVVDDNLRSLMFGNYMGRRDDVRMYDEITDVDKLKEVGVTQSVKHIFLWEMHISYVPYP